MQQLPSIYRVIARRYRGFNKRRNLPTGNLGFWPGAVAILKLIIFFRSFRSSSPLSHVPMTRLNFLECTREALSVGVFWFFEIALFFFIKINKGFSSLGNVILRLRNLMLNLTRTFWSETPKVL